MKDKIIIQMKRIYDKYMEETDAVMREYYEGLLIGYKNLLSANQKLDDGRH